MQTRTRRFLWLLLTSITLLLAGCLTPQAAPTPTPAPTSTPTPLLPIEKYSLLVDEYFYGAAWSPDSTMLAISGRFDEQRGISLFVLGFDQPKWIKEEEMVSSITFSTDGKYIVYALKNNTLNFLDVETGEKVREIPGEKNCVGKDTNSAIFARENNYYTVSFGYTRPPYPFESELAVWNSDTNSCQVIAWALGLPALTLDLNHDDFLLLNLSSLSGAGQSEVQVWNTQTGLRTCAVTSPDYDNGFRGVLHPTQNEMIVSSQEGRVLWDVTTCEVIQVISDTNDGSVEAFAPTGNRYVMYDDGALTIWDAHTHAPLNRITTPGLGSVLFDPSGSYLLGVFGGSPQTLVVWQLEP